jgi:hypothetical protein
MRPRATEITKLKAWVNDKKKGAGRAEWSVDHLRKLGYQDYPEIEDPMERLLQQVTPHVHYPRFSEVMEKMKQAWRSEGTEKKRTAELKPLKAHLTEPRKRALAGMAKANRETFSDAISRLIDEAGQAQAMAEKRVAARHKSQMEAQKKKTKALEQAVNRSTLPMLMRGRLASDLMAIKDRHYQLEVAALRWLRELCECHTLINDAGIRSPLLPDQQAKANVMFETSIRGLSFLGQEIDPEASLQQLLDLGEMDLLQSQPQPAATHNPQKEKKPRKTSESKKKPEAVDQAGTGRVVDADRIETQAEAAISSDHKQESVSADVDQALVQMLAGASGGEDDLISLSEEAGQSAISMQDGTLAQVLPVAVSECIELPVWTDDDLKNELLSGINEEVNMEILEASMKSIKPNKSMSGVVQYQDRLKRILCSYKSRIDHLNKQSASTIVIRGVEPSVAACEMPAKRGKETDCLATKLEYQPIKGVIEIPEEIKRLSISIIDVRLMKFKFRASKGICVDEVELDQLCWRFAELDEGATDKVKAANEKKDSVLSYKSE